MKSTNDIRQRIRKFCEDRNWSHSNPTALLAATASELGELIDHFQWQTEFKELSGEEKKEISYELVDVLWYLYRFADKTDIDIEKAFNEKIPKLEKKFPIGSNPKERHELYRKTGKNRLYE